MIKLLRKWLRAWLLDEAIIQEKQIRTLQINTLDGVITACATSITGFYLRCKMHNGTERLVAEHQACDKEAFWLIWKQLGGSTKAVWEDGTPFEPTE